MTIIYQSVLYNHYLYGDAYYKMFAEYLWEELHVPLFFLTVTKGQCLGF